MPKRRSDQIAALNTLSQKIGEESENRAEDALRFMAQNGEIDHYYRSLWSEELDKIGIDFLVWIEPAVTVPLQVKSSERGKEEFIAEYGTRIPCVAIKRFDSRENIVKKIRLALSIDTATLEGDLDLALQQTFDLET